MIGAKGNGISQGQRQRILIARAVYKGRNFCSSTKRPMHWIPKMKSHRPKPGAVFQGKTVVVVAHRLSTVKNASQIVVLDKGSWWKRGRIRNWWRNEGLFQSYQGSTGIGGRRLGGWEVWTLGGLDVGRLGRLDVWRFGGWDGTLGRYGT